MNVNIKINQTFEDEKRLKAFATAFLDNQFVVTGIRVVDCKNGLVVMMPSRKDSKGEYRDVCFPIIANLRATINEATLKAYEEYIQKGTRSEE